MNKHKHRAIKGASEVRCYSGSVSRDQEPRAAGGVCIVEQCLCGAYRKTNSNGGFVERGAWIVPDGESRA